MDISGSGFETNVCSLLPLSDSFNTNLKCFFYLGFVLPLTPMSMNPIQTNFRIRKKFVGTSYPKKFRVNVLCEESELICSRLCFSNLLLLNSTAKPCLSDVGVLGSSATCKCLKLTAIIGQKVLFMLK